MVKETLFISLGFLFSVSANATSFATNVTGGTVTSKRLNWPFLWTSLRSLVILMMGKDLIK